MQYSKVIEHCKHPSSPPPRLVTVLLAGKWGGIESRVTAMWSMRAIARQLALLCESVRESIRKDGVDILDKLLGAELREICREI